MSQKKVSIVVSVYNEEDALNSFYKALNQELSQLSYQFEIIFVNDGSVDKSRSIIDTLSSEDDRVKGIHFSTNFGHEAAMIAGIDHSSGDAIICIDADLQHPVDRIKDMLSEYEEGYEVINMVRESRDDGGFLKNVVSKVFYKFLNKIAPINFEANGTDFFLISKNVAKVLRSEYRERTRFVRGFIQILGFKRTKLGFKASARAAGESKYNLGNLLILSADAIVSFSKLPLLIGLFLGVICSFIAIGIGIYSLVMNIIGDTPPGYTTLILVLTVFFAFQFFLIGVIGLYIGYMFEENKKRPIYIVEEISSRASKE